MKRRICSIITAFILCIALVMPVYANNDEIHHNYINDYDDTSFISNLEFMHSIANMFDIKYDAIAQENYIFEYYTGYSHYNMIQRQNVLVALMRLYHLYPDFNNITLYEWADSPNIKMSNQELAYITYAKELGITSGTSETTFGFNQSATIWQIKTFIERINNLENIEELQKECPLQVIDTEDYNREVITEPLICEFFYGLPEEIRVGLVTNDYQVYLYYNTIPGYEDVGAIGIHYSYPPIIGLTTKGNLTTYRFTRIFSHEIGHAIENLAKTHLVYGVDNCSDIIDDEIPKMVLKFRSYAGTNVREYIACAVEYAYIYGEDALKTEYPSTYEYFMQLINIIQELYMN